MVAVLFVYVVVYAAVLALPGALVAALYRDRIADYFAGRRARLAAARNARHLTGPTCVLCLGLCTDKDCYEAKRGWYHANCMKNLME